MQKLTSPAELDPALKGKKAIVLFHSTWCPFCRSFKPSFDAVVKDQRAWEPTEVLLEEDDNPLWDRFGIQAVPTVLFFDDGKVVGRLDAELGVGLRESDLRRAVT
jgi:thioredoxin 1